MIEGECGVCMSDSSRDESVFDRECWGLGGDLMQWCLNVNATFQTANL